MQFDGLADCASYAEAELTRILRSRPSWQVTPATAPAERFTPAQPGSHRPQGEIRVWRISLSSGGNRKWYRLEADLHEEEFLIWFGNRQVGAEGIHHIMRPAIHVAFRDLSPMDHLELADFTLGSVLELMLDSVSAGGLAFEPNDFSLT